MKPSILRTFLCCICTLFFGVALTTTQSFADQSIGSATCFSTLSEASSACRLANGGNICKQDIIEQQVGVGVGNTRCNRYCYSTYTNNYLYGGNIGAYTIFCNQCKEPYHLVYGGIGCYITSNVNDYCITNTTTTSGCYNTTTYKGGTSAARTVEWGKQTDSSSSLRYNGTVDEMCRDAINNTYSCASTCYKSGSTVTSNSGCSACPSSAMSNSCNGTTFLCVSTGSNPQWKVINHASFPDGCRSCPPNATCNGSTTFQCNNSNYPFINGDGCSACPEHATCSGTTVSCNQGYYYNSSGGDCTQCPEYKGVNGTTSNSGSLSVSACYIASGSHTNDTGTFTLSQNCSYCTNTCIRDSQCSSLGSNYTCQNGCCGIQALILRCISGKQCLTDSDCGDGGCVKSACVCDLIFKP